MNYEVKLNLKWHLPIQNFGYIIDCLITVYGKEKFTKYIRGLLNCYHQEKVFNDIYRIDFNICLDNFK